MHTLKQIIENAGVDRVIDSNLYVKNGIVYLTLDNTQFKHENHNWYQLCGEKWVNLQGGVPSYESEVEENPDENILENEQFT